MIRFEIRWNDISEETREEIIDSCLESLMETVQEEGEKLLQKEWNDPQPQSWQEAWVRYDGVQHIFWDEYEKGVEGAEVPSQEDWVYWLEEHLRDYVENKCFEAVRYLEVGIDV